jgi:hypothetical protein
VKFDGIYHGTCDADAGANFNVQSSLQFDCDENCINVITPIRYITTADYGRNFITIIKSSQPVVR